MTVYKITGEAIDKVPETSFQALGLTERYDIQRLLRDQVSIIAPDCLVISEEFGRWEESNRRVDLLAVDKKAHLVIIELKRTADGGHMDLQAIRYAAMVSAFSFSDVVEIYGQYIQKRELEIDPTESLLSFLSWTEGEEDDFASSVRIILAAADFSRELTSSVIWLNDACDLDIRCVRMKPYGTKENILLDVQQIIPLPEAQDYQVRLKAKKQLERRQKRQYDYTQYDVVCDDKSYQGMNKRRTILQIITFLAFKGLNPAEIDTYLSQQKPRARLFYHCEQGHCSPEQMDSAIDRQGLDPTRYFTSEDELIEFEGSTYAICNQWGKGNFDLAVGYLKSNYQSAGFTLEESNK